MPFCCASTAALLSLSKPAAAATKPPREASIKQLEDALARAKAGELRAAQLEVALAAAVRRSEVVSRQVVGLEADLESASRLLNTLEEDEICEEGAEDRTEFLGGLAATRSLWRALFAIERVVAESDERAAAPLSGSLAGAWQALTSLDERVCELEAKRGTPWSFACCMGRFE